MKISFKILILFSFIFISCRGTTSKQPPIHLLQNMDDVGRLDPQSQNLASYDLEEEPFEDSNGNGVWNEGEVFEDLNENGKWDDKSLVYISEKKTSMISMPEGTVDTSPYSDSITDREVKENALVGSGRNENGEFIKKNPYTITSEFLDRGEERYNIYCSVCHGISGNGDGMVLNEEYSWEEAVKPASLLDLRDKEDICFDGYLYDVISNGKNRMGGYAKQINIEDRWAIVAYVRSLSYASGYVPECECSASVSEIKSNLAKMSSLEQQLISEDFKCMVESYSKEVQKFYGKETMKEIQKIINCDSFDGEWGPGSRNKWRSWREVN